MNEPLYAVVAVDISTRQAIHTLARRAEGVGGVSSGSPPPGAYHYAIPRELSEQLVVGQLVWVPFGREQRQGVLLGFDEQAPVLNTRPILAISQAEPFLLPYQLQLAEWLSHRYLAPLWDCLLLILPSGVLQGTERVLRRSTKEIAAPLSRDSRAVLAWVEGQGGSSTQKLVKEVLGSEKRARAAVSDLLRERLLRDEVVVKPPGIRPRLERFVTLLPSPEAIDSYFRALGRQSRQADALQELAENDGELPLGALLEALDAGESVLDRLIERNLLEIEPGTFVRAVSNEEGDGRSLSPAQKEALAWIESWASEEPIPLRAILAAGIRRATIQSLAGRGYARVDDARPDRVRLRIARYRLPSVLDELRGTEMHRALVTYLQANPADMTTSELYEATGAAWRHLEAMERVGLIRIEEREVLRNPLAGRVIPPSDAPHFTPEQEAVWAELAGAIRQGQRRPGESAVFLLHGVTGSGKTEIYLRAVAETLAQGKQAIVMVPEIALTPQTIARFGSRFGDLIALQHSQLSEGERYDEWRRLRDGRAQIAIGSRSAIFAPLSNLGLIVMDEEHEWTYKQGHLPGYRFPQYHARDVAEKLAALTGATVILGSATPSIESYRRAETGRYRLLEMGQRVQAQVARRPVALVAARLAAEARADGYGEAGALAPVQVVDMRQELRAGNSTIFSRDLRRAIAQTLDSSQQAILFLNRRGSHSFVMCRDCGWVEECRQCDSPMTAHRGLPYLICHQCSATVPMPQICPQCLSNRVKHFGVGTQQVEEVAQSLFPDARIARWDRDTTRGRGAHERLLSLFAAGQADILIGTQMVAKGLDLPLVTLVGIISADTALHLPDFRSGERTFQLLTQVAGRAGRSHLGGKVILQTYSPLHYAVRCASRHHYHEFYRYELAFRREHAYPPYTPLVKLVYSDPSARQAEQAAHDMAAELVTRVAQLGLPATTVIGPAPSFFGKVRGKYRWQLLIRGPHSRALVRDTPPGFGWEVDVDPASVL